MNHSTADAKDELWERAGERPVRLGTLAALATLAPLSVNLYLPALPDIGEALDVDVPQI